MAVKKRRIVMIFALIMMMAIAVVVASLYTYKDGFKKGKIMQQVFIQMVEQYRPTVEKYAVEYDVEEHIDVLLAMMMQESGGRGNDPMQSSESLCGKVGCIDDPELSIKQGVSYFADSLAAAEGDVELAVQSYNFGIGFVDYVTKNKTEYNHALTVQFSQEMYKKAEDKSIYTCLRKEAKQLDACYGDIYYARDVMEYKQNFASK